MLSKQTLNAKIIEFNISNSVTCLTDINFTSIEKVYSELRRNNCKSEYSEGTAGHFEKRRNATNTKRVGSLKKLLVLCFLPRSLN